MELCGKNESKRWFSSMGLFGVFRLWQSCSNHSDGSHFRKLLSGSEHPKGKPNLLTNRDDKHGVLRDDMDDKILGVGDGKRTVKELMNEERRTEQSEFDPVGFLEKKEKSDDRRRNLSHETKEAEAFINEALKRYLRKDRRNHRSQRFLDAIRIMKSNEELFLKLMQDPNSLLAKHIRNLQELHAEKERSTLVQKPKHSESFVRKSTKNSKEVLGTNKFPKRNTYSLVWDKIKTRYEYPPNARKHPRASRIVEISENASCRCSFLHSHSSRNKNKIAEPVSKSTKGDGKVPSFRPEITLADGSVLKGFSSSSVGYSTARDVDVVEEEARRHLSEMLMNVNRAKCFSNEEPPRILGTILGLPRSQIFDFEFDKVRNRVVDTKGRDGISSTTDGISLSDQMENRGAINLSQPRDLNIREFPYSSSSINGTTSERCIDAGNSSDKVGNSGCSAQDSPLEYQQLKPSVDNSSSTSISFRALEITDRARDKSDLLSPVSVLENCFCDDLDSPSRIATQPDKSPIQPPHIEFEEHYPMGSVNKSDLISTYTEALLHTTCSGWDELFLSSQCPFSSNQFFDPTLMADIKLPFVDSCDRKLYFDSVNEAVSEVYQSCFSFSPFASSMQSKPVSMKTDVVDEIKTRVDRYFHPPALPGTVEQLAGNDHIRSQIWTDIREDIEGIMIQVVESIVEEVVRETMFAIVL